MATYKARGAIGQVGTGVTTLPVPITAAVSGDYCVVNIYNLASASAPTPPSSDWILAHNEPDGGGGSRSIFYRAFTSSVAAGNVNFTVASGGIGKSVMFSGAGSGPPTVLNNILLGATWWQTAPITVPGARAAAHFGQIFAASTQGTLSNQGTISSTNTSRDYDTITIGGRLQTATSAITSASGGSVRGTYTGATNSWVMTAIIPEPAPAAPTGHSATGAVRAFTINPGTSSGATQYRARRRRTNLVNPSLTTQSSAPWDLDRLDDAVGTDGTYTYTWPGANARIYVLDTGVRYSHSQFTGRTAPGYNATGVGSYDTDSVGHGTAVASAALGTLSGTTKAATLVSVKVIVGTEASYTDINWTNFDAAVDWIIADADGAPAVVQYAAFFPANGQANYSTITAIFQKLIAAGIHVVLAIGNEGTLIDVGSGYTDVIFVGGTTNTDAKTSASRWGNGVTIYAPGENVSTALISGDSNNGTNSGTSFAAPLVAGVVARIIDGNPLLSPRRAKEVLTSQGRAVVTGVPVGTNLLLNSSSNTDDWFLRSVSTGAQSDTGFGDGEAYEYQFGAGDASDAWSAWSTSSNATTVSPITGSISSSLPALTQSASGETIPPGVSVAISSQLPALTQSAVGAVDRPVFAGSITSQLPAITHEAVGVVTPPGSSGVITSTLPALTQGAVGVISAPAYEAAIVSTLPALTQALNGDVSVPVYITTVESMLPALTQAASGAVELPQYVGTIGSVLPALTQSATGSIDNPPGVIGSIASLLPALTQAASGAVTPPSGVSGVITSTLPALTQDAIGVVIAPSYGGTISSLLPALTQAAAGEVLNPIAGITFALGDTEVSFALGDVEVSLIIF